METNRMQEKERPSERERRDWIIILILLLLGFLCVILAGERALRFSPNWKLNTNMDSNIDPNSDFLTNRPSSFLEPLDPAILTNAVWVDLYQTPGAVFPTSPVLSTGITSPTPVIQASPTPTSLIVVTMTNTVAPTVTPTSTFIYYPPAPTNTPKPPVPPTKTPIPVADLAITKTDGVPSYVAGGTLTYTITVINNGPDDVTGAVVTDNLPSQISNWTWSCTQQNGGATGCNAAPNNSSNFTDTINLPNGAGIVYTVTAIISG